MKKIRELPIFNAISLGIHLLMVVLVQLELINPLNVGEVSDQLPSLFTPAGSTFIIWSVIYAALIAFCVYHLVKGFRDTEHQEANREVNNIGWLFVINNLATAAWLVAWVNKLLLLSVILILVQLVSLILMHSRLKIHDARRSFASKAFTQFPISIYLGWISIATIANISAWLTANGWNGWGMSDINWTITMIAVAVLITVNVINRKKNVFFGLVVIWALYGILKKRMAIDQEDYEPVIVVTWAALIIVGLACIFGLVRNLRKR